MFRQMDWTRGQTTNVTIPTEALPNFCLWGYNNWGDNLGYYLLFLHQNMFSKTNYADSMIQKDQKMQFLH